MHIRMHYAHSTERLDRSDWQPLAEHLRDVAKLAAAFAGDFGASRAAALSGWMHDLGKYAPEFQAYIAGKGQSVDHSTAGAQNVLQFVAVRAARLSRP